MDEKVIENRNLANGVVLSIIDQSKKIAGDRWFVKVVCRAAVHVAATDFAEQDQSPRLDRIKDLMGEEVVLLISKERNFIDDNDKEPVIEQLVDRIFDNMLDYLESNTFPVRLFQQRFADLHEKVLLEERYPPRDDCPDDDDGPADFSACFRD